MRARAATATGRQWQQHRPNKRNQRVSLMLSAQPPPSLSIKTSEEEKKLQGGFSRPALKCKGDRRTCVVYLAPVWRKKRKMAARQPDVRTTARPTQRHIVSLVIRTTEECVPSRVSVFAPRVTERPRPFHCSCRIIKSDCRRRQSDELFELRHDGPGTRHT